MTAADRSRLQLAAATRWAGRLLALPLVAVVVAQTVGLDLPVRFRGPPSEITQQTAFMLSVLGLVVGWLWEGAGAMLVLGGMAAFTALHYLATRQVPGDLYPLFWVPGLLYLGSYAAASWPKNRTA